MNRIPVKWIRDRAKSAYRKDSECYICGKKENLELHHTNSITLLYNSWAKKKGYTDEDILNVRDEFIDEHKKELYESVFTLCKNHHDRLHAVYGKAPPLLTASKQEGWIEKQRSKFTNYKEK